MKDTDYDEEQQEQPIVIILTTLLSSIFYHIVSQCHAIINYYNLWLKYLVYLLNSINEKVFKFIQNEQGIGP